MNDTMTVSLLDIIENIVAEKVIALNIFKKCLLQICRNASANA